MKRVLRTVVFAVGLSTAMLAGPGDGIRGNSFQPGIQGAGDGIRGGFVWSFWLSLMLGLR